MKRQQRLLIELTLDQLRSMTALLQQRHGIGEMSVAASQVVVCLEQSEELLWKDSAWAMGEVLQASIDDTQDYMCMATNMHRWILFETPKATALGEIAAVAVQFRTDTESVIEAARRLHPPKARFDAFTASLRTAPIDIHQWMLHFFDSNGTTLWRLLLERDVADMAAARWSVDSLLCPWKRCHELNNGDLMACKGCVKAARHWLVWLGVAHGMLLGHYRESSDPTEPEYITMTDTHIERDLVQTWKSREVKTQHRLRVIHFDASLAPSPARSQRGSWLAGRAVGDEETLYALDDSAVIYVPHGKSEHDRTFRSSRYKAARGLTKHVEVGEHLRPITVGTLKARAAQKSDEKAVTIVQAKKFAGLGAINDV